MSLVLQELLVTLLVAGCVLYSTWRLLPARLRRVRGRRRACDEIAHAVRGVPPDYTARGRAESNSWCTSPLTIFSW